MASNISSAAAPSSHICSASPAPASCESLPDELLICIALQVAPHDLGRLVVLSRRLLSLVQIALEERALSAFRRSSLQTGWDEKTMQRRLCDTKDAYRRSMRWRSLWPMVLRFECHDNPFVITVRAVDHAGLEVFFKMRLTTHAAKLMAAYCHHRGLADSGVAEVARREVRGFSSTQLVTLDLARPLMSRVTHTRTHAPAHSPPTLTPSSRSPRGINKAGKCHSISPAPACSRNPSRAHAGALLLPRAAAQVGRHARGAGHGLVGRARRRPAGSNPAVDHADDRGRPPPPTLSRGRAPLHMRSGSLPCQLRGSPPSLCASEARLSLTAHFVPFATGAYRW